MGISHTVELSNRDRRRRFKVVKLSIQNGENYHAGSPSAKENYTMKSAAYLLYRLNLLREYFESPLPPFATGTLSRFPIRRLTVDLSSSMYVLSISFTTNVGQGRYFYSTAISAAI